MDALDRAVLAPPRVTGLPRTSPMQGLDRRRLDPVDVLGQSVAAVAPAGVAATFPLLISGVAGSGLIFAMLIAVAVMLLVTTSINQFARRIVAPGGLYTFTALGLGPRFALGVAASLLAGYAFIVAFALMGSSRAIGNLISRAGLPVSGAGLSVILLILAATCLTIVIVGVRISTRITLVIEAIAVTAILALVVGLIVRVGWRGPGMAFSAPPDPILVAVGAALAITAFVGFESAVTLGVEARRPRAVVPRVLTWTVIGTGILYMLATYGQDVGLGAVGQSLTSSSSPVDDLARAYGVDWAAVAVDAIVATSFLAAAIAHTNALARVLVALARDGVVPTALGRTHRRFRTPWPAACAAVPVIAAGPVVLLLLGVPVWPLMQTTIVAAAAGFILAYLLVCASVPRFLTRVGERTPRPVIVAVTATVALLLGLVTHLTVEVTRGSGLGVAAFGLVSLGVFVSFHVRMRRSGRPSNIGSYDLAVQADVLGGSG